MKGLKIAVAVTGAALLVAFLAYPAFAATSSTSTGSNPWPTSISGARAGLMHRIAAFFSAHGLLGMGQGGAAPSFTSGQVITVTSTSGNYFVVGSQGKTNGTASGTLTFTVGGKLHAGYTLSVSGVITVAGTTYTVTSGSAVMGPGGANIVGTGATSPSGTFILRASARGDFAGSATSKVSLDFSNGTTEYAVILTGSIAG